MENGISRCSKILGLFLFMGLLSIVLLSGSVVGASKYVEQSDPFYYISPRPGSNYVRPDTTILLRTDQFAITDLLKTDSLVVEGRISGAHSGDAELASDDRTVIFRPHAPFAPGETVQVTISLPIQMPDSRNFNKYAFAFTVTEPANSDQESDFAAAILQPLALNQPQEKTDAEIPSFGFLTAPPNLPPIAAERWPGELGEGYLFVSTFNWRNLGNSIGYMLILDNDGEPVYYGRPLDLPVTVDFKKQANGLLTYFAPATTINKHYAINQQYEVVDEYMAEGYTTDLHDLQILGNGNALLMVHDLQIVDMSELVPGGSTEAPVIGCIIQEVDKDNKKVFQWRSWDHIDILDTVRPLDDNPLRYIHCNSLEQDHDGNILISSRHLNEVTKIDRQSGEIIWRMGGRQNEFDFTNDYPFTYQHDARRLPNGHLTVYDNGVTHRPKHSRGVEYLVDEAKKTVKKIAEFRNTPETYALSMGNLQTLSNRNVVVGWGSSSAPMLTEFDRDGNKLLEFSTEFPFATYRAFRFPWKGIPTWPPALAARMEENTVHLHFSWNGSTETASYKIIGGRNRNHLRPIATVLRDGFETTYSYRLTGKGFWYFQIIPVNNSGDDGPPSNVVQVARGGKSAYLSYISVP